MRTQKTIFCIVFFAAFGLMFTSCTKNFDSINTDPTKPSESNFDPNYLFTTAQLGYANVTEFQLYELSCITQQFACTFDYYGGGDKYTQQLTAYNSRFFSDGLYYAGQLTEAQHLAEKKDKAKYSNLIQMSRMLRVLILQRVTDIYGDIPYTEAGMGKFGVQYPKYDPQATIYRDMLSTLDDAINKLDAAKPLATGDLFYAGKIESWKKLGYSIMLRVAMRLTKADEAVAKQYAEKAAGNTFTSFADNAIVKLDGGPHDLTINKTANAIGLNDFQEIRWSKTFIDHLAANNDPRLYALTEKADTGIDYNNDISRGGIYYTKQNPAAAGYVNEAPMGMPNGYTLSGSNQINASPGYPGPTGSGSNANPLGNYARPKLQVFAKRNLPTFVITYAQSELLLAEAKARGWNVGATSAEEHFQNGIKGALEGLSQWNVAVGVPIDSIATYIKGRTLGATSLSGSLKAINTEYWIASVFDFAEAWANWRRSGYPVLVPVSFPGNITNGTIPRRLPYPSTENANNPANYQEALGRLGGNDLPTINVWWDK